MSTRKSHRKVRSNGVDTRVELPRGQVVEIYRENTLRTIRDIRKGIVNEEDIDKMQNFFQAALALMQMVSVETFRQAQRNAEISHFMRLPGSEVVLNPELQNIPPVVDATVTQALDEYFTTPHVDKEQ